MNRSKTKRTLSIAAVLAVSLAALLTEFSNFAFHPLPRDLLGMGDCWLQNGPYAYFTDYAIHNGELPLWNPLTECGKPHAANPQVALYYPPNLLRSILTFHPTPMRTHKGLALMIAAHMLLAAVATYYFARAYGLTEGASWVVTFAFVFSANFLARALVHWPFIAMMAWLPVLMLLTLRMLNEPILLRKLFWALCIGLILGFTLLIGFPQLDLYIAFTLCAYVALDRLLKTPWRDPSQRRARLRSCVTDAVFIGVAFIVSAPVAAAMLYPAAQLSGLTARAKGVSLSYEFDKNITHSVPQVIEYLITFPGSKSLEDLHFIGAGAFLLVFGALLYARKRDTALFGILFLMLLDCSLGPPFPFARLMQALAPFRMFSPERASLVACFPLAMLAGLGADAVWSNPWNRRYAVVRALVLAVGGLAACYGLYVWTHPNRLVHHVPTLAVAIPATLLILMLVSGLAPRWRAWPWLFAVLVIAENLAWSHPYLREILDYWPCYPTTKPVWERTPEDNAKPWPRSEPLEADFFTQKTLSLDNRRGTSVQWNRRVYDLTPVINGYETLFLYQVRQLLCSPWAQTRYTREINAFEVTRDNERGNLFLKRSFWLARQYVRANLPGKQALFPAATTVYLPQAPPNLPVPRVSPADVPNHSISSNFEVTEVPCPAALKTPLYSTIPNQHMTFALPPVRMPALDSALCIDVQSSGTGRIETKFRDPGSGQSEWGKTTGFGPTTGTASTIEIPVPDFDTLGTTLTVYFDHPSTAVEIRRIYLKSDRADENRLIHITQRSANTTDVEVGPLPGYRVLTFLDAAYPGWKAYLDGKRCPLYVADDVFKAVIVPPGTHHVHFLFQPRRVYIGLAVSVLSIAGLIAAMVVLWRRTATTASGSIP